MSVEEAISLKNELHVARLILTHINHFNKPRDQLDAYFSRFKGITVAYDGMCIDI